MDQNERPIFDWIVGLFTALATLMAGRSFVVHDNIIGKIDKVREDYDLRIQKIEQSMLTRDELRDNLHDFMLTVQRSEDRFDGRLEDLKEDLKIVIDKLDRHFEEERKIFQLKKLSSGKEI